jgi:hypothetical protein
MKRLLSLFRPVMPLEHRAVLWRQVRGWSGVRFWMKAADAGARAFDRSIWLPEGTTPAEMRL